MFPPPVSALPEIYAGQPWQRKLKWVVESKNHVFDHPVAMDCCGGSPSLRIVRLDCIQLVPQSEDLCGPKRGTLDWPTIQRSKNAASQCVIPLNQPSRSAFARMLERARSLGFHLPEHSICFLVAGAGLTRQSPLRSGIPLGGACVKQLSFLACASTTYAIQSLLSWSR